MSILQRKHSHSAKPATRRKTPFCIVLALLVLMNHATVAHGDSLEEFGDIAQIALPLIGLGATGIYSDWEGTKQLAYSGVTTLGTTFAMKAIFGKIRPNSGSDQSFPSGHTASAFWGASFLDQRYGKWWGIPSYAAAAVVAYSRVDADAHYIDDTLMGASIGLMSSWLWVTPHEGAISLIPFQQGDGGGLRVSFSDNDKPDTYSGLNDNDRWRYAILFGPAWQQENRLQSPIGTGTEINLESFLGTNDPTTTAIPILERYIGQHLIQVSFTPFEVRDNGQFTQNTLFNNTVFLPTEDIRSEYRLNDFRLQYYYELLPDSRVILQVGGGVSYQHTDVVISTTDNVKREKQNSDIVLPLVNAALGYQFTPRISLTAELSGFSLSDQDQLDANISVQYRINKFWDVGMGYGIYDRNIEDDGLRNKLKYDVVMTYVGYSFY